MCPLRKLATPRYYRPELDGVRFVAFLLVYLHHNFPQADDPHFAHLATWFAPALTAFHSACSFGLCLFFTLSAFLICELLIRERHATGTVDVKSFYLRRILRIWPLYYLALIIGLIIALLPGGGGWSVARDLGWFAVFMGSWFSALHGWIAIPIYPLWSISVEEQFYVMAPWTVKYLSRAWMFRFCYFLILVANVWLYYFGSVATDGHLSTLDQRIWTDTFVQFECFAVGMLLSLGLRGRLPILAIWQRVAFFIGCWCCWITACYGLHSRFNVIGAPDNPGSARLMGGYALTSIGSLLMMIAFMGIDARFIPRWTIYLGRISFGLYIYHQFAIEIWVHIFGRGPDVPVAIRVLRVFLSLSGTVLLASLSYRYVETPFLKMKENHAVIESQPMSGT
jgi:peptidoglycan/LPS O-acetylase OafA/YrhL